MSDGSSHSVVGSAVSPLHSTFSKDATTNDEPTGTDERAFRLWVAECDARIGDLRVTIARIRGAEDRVGDLPVSSAREVARQHLAAARVALADEWGAIETAIERQQNVRRRQEQQDAYTASRSDRDLRVLGRIG